MKILKRFTAILLAAVFAAAGCSQAFALPAPVNASWTDLHLDPSGGIRFRMVLPAGSEDLVPQYYDVAIEINTGSGWRENYDTTTYASSDTFVDEGITFRTPGSYRFRVMCRFENGLVSMVSGYSNICRVTKQDITPVDPQPTPVNPVGPGPGGNPSGPGAQGKSAWYQDPATKKWYYAATTGVWLRSTWQFINNHWYYFDDDAAMHTGWLSKDGYWYYLHPVEAPEGHMATGFFKVDNKWYYCDPANGRMLTGAISVGGFEYYMDASGAMLVNEGTPDGRFYGPDGRRIR